MKIDVSGIEKDDGAFLEFDMEEKLPCLDDIHEDCSFPGAVSFKGRITNNRGILRLKGCLSTGYTTVCVRCMEPLDKQVDIEIKEEIVNLDNTAGIKEESVYTFSGPNLFVDRIIKDNIILSLPMRELCSPGCKGLCPRCGQNLNAGLCGCKEDKLADSRLSALKDYFGM
jgi:uncharacterized protein